MVWWLARGKVLIDCLECQFTFETVASGIRDGADRLCPDLFNATEFLFFAKEIVLFKLCACVYICVSAHVCVCVCVCAHVHKDGSLYVCSRPLTGMDKFQPSGLSI